MYLERKGHLEFTFAAAAMSTIALTAEKAAGKRLRILPRLLQRLPPHRLRLLPRPQLRPLLPHPQGV